MRNSLLRRRCGGRTARARRRERPDISRAQGPGPGPVRSPRARTRRYTVCKKKGRCDFTTIQKAVNKARAGDTIRVRNGVYREAVKINGTKKRYLKLIGNPKHPDEGAARAPAGTCRTASSSTTPTRSPSTASWRATTSPTGSSSRTSTATR